MHTWVPALLAVLAALMIAAGTVLRQRASRVNGAITPGWWAGAAIALCGFGLQASALGLGSILLGYTISGAAVDARAVGIGLGAGERTITLCVYVILIAYLTITRVGGVSDANLRTVLDVSVP